MNPDNPTPPAPRTYCVWADHTRRVYQEVEAASPEDAYRIAGESPGDWQSCFEHESNGYCLAADVQDVETDESFTVGEDPHCPTCGSEIVATVNASHFRDGECGPCESEYSRTQRERLDATEGSSTALTHRPDRNREMTVRTAFPNDHGRAA